VTESALAFPARWGTGEWVMSVTLFKLTPASA
jgi:hypothetical protein